MSEINLLEEMPYTKRNYDAREAEKTPEIVAIAKKFGEEFFDGERKYGYGGYRYDGRWKPVVRKLCEHYKLPSDARILDVGCGKGFMLHDFKEYMPDCEVAGVDVSQYAIHHAMESVQPFLLNTSAESLPYADNSFDLVISINTIHNLPVERLKVALKEIQRVSKGHSFVTLDAWRNEKEKENLYKWVLTAETMMAV